MPVWMNNLQRSLLDRQVAILHGNLRDIYIDNKKNVYRDLGALIRHLADELRENDVPLFDITFYTPYEAPKRVHLAGACATRPTGSNTLLVDDDDTATAVGGAIPDPRTVVATWFRELTSVQESRLSVLYYLDKLVPYGADYGETERQILIWLERLVDKITPNNRLILVALRDTMVPIELYTNAPKAFIQPIPMPDAWDREIYLRHLLEDLLGPDRLTDQRLRALGNLTDGLFLRDLENIAKAIRDAGSFGEQDLKRLLNRYRFGEQKDYFGELSITRIDSAVDWFEGVESVKGQYEAISHIREVLTVARAGLSGVASGTPSKPKGVLFFAGPTGVGKTLVAKKLAKFLFDSESAFLRFDMSEFKEEHTVSKLIGSPPGYIGSDQGGMLTNGVREKPFSVVLFDEIEKAHAKIMDIFLQILDEGRLTDSRGQTVFFTETIIVFTSNIGTGADDRQALDSIRLDRALSDEERKARIRSHFRHAVDEYFRGTISRPELLNRFGRNIIPFNFIDDMNTQSLIFGDHMKRIGAEVEDLYRASSHKIQIDDRVPQWLGQTHGPRLAAFGGRGIVNCLDAEIILPLSESLLRAQDQGRRNVNFNVTVSDEEQRIQIVD